MSLFWFWIYVVIGLDFVLLALITIIVIHTINVGRSLRGRKEYEVKRKRKYIPMWVSPEYPAAQYLGALAAIASLVVTRVWWHWFWPAIPIFLFISLIGAYPSIKNWFSYQLENLKLKWHG